MRGYAPFPPFPSPPFSLIPLTRVHAGSSSTAGARRARARNACRASPRRAASAHRSSASARASSRPCPAASATAMTTATAMQARRGRPDSARRAPPSSARPPPRRRSTGASWSARRATRSISRSSDPRVVVEARRGQQEKGTGLPGTFLVRSVRFSASKRATHLYYTRTIIGHIVLSICASVLILPVPPNRLHVRQCAGVYIPCTYRKSTYPNPQESRENTLLFV